MPADDLQADRPVRAVPGRGDVAEPGGGGVCRPAERPSGRVESVHLCDYPAGDPAAIDEELSERMALVREIVSLGRSARMGAKLKVRQPLAQVEVVLADTTHQAWLEEHAALICDELNVKRVEFIEKAEQYITYTRAARPEAAWPAAGQAAAGAAKAAGRSRRRPAAGRVGGRRATSRCRCPTGRSRSTPTTSKFVLQAKEGWAAAQGHAVVVVLATELTDDLIREGLARELVRTIQDRRKEMGCEFTDRIAVGIVTESAELKAAIEQFRDYIRARRWPWRSRSGAVGRRRVDGG